MKKRGLLFLCLSIISCDLDNDKHQAPVDNSSLQTIDKSICLNFAFLDTLREIATKLNYPGITETRENLNFFCDCSKNGINKNKDTIEHILKQPLNQGRLFREKESNAVKMLKKLGKDNDFDKSICALLDPSINENSSMTKILAATVRLFMEYSISFFKNLKEQLDTYKRSVENSEKLTNSVIAHQRLCELFGSFLVEYKNILEAKSTYQDDEYVIFLFFGNILPQLYNIYYENIFRLNVDKNGVYREDLSLVGSIH